MRGESTAKIVGVTLGVCLVCSVLVSAAAVFLKPIQDENKRIDKLKNILMAGNLLAENTDIIKTFDEKIESRIIELDNGRSLAQEKYNDILNPEDFDIKAVAADPEYGRTLPADQDQAQIKKIPKFMAIYLVKENDNLERYILPVYGYGLWSILYGFLALDKDLETIEGLTFYEHGETPGLGGEVDNPRWKALWVGKQAFDENGNIGIQVIKGKVDNSKPDAKYKVDGLSGATITTRGIDNLIHFWLGSNGYGPFITLLKEGGLDEQI